MKWKNHLIYKETSPYAKKANMKKKEMERKKNH